MSVRVQFVGNLQCGRLQSMFQRSLPSGRAGFIPTAPDNPRMAPDMLCAALEAADIVVVQAQLQPGAGLTAEAARQLTAGEVVVIPEVRLDGIASLERDGPGEESAILGEDVLVAAAGGLARPTLMRRFLAGEIDMAQEARLAAALARLRAVEAGCDVAIAATIADMIRDTPVLYGVASPTQPVLFRLFERLCDYLGLDPDPRLPRDPAFFGSLALPKGFRAFTPWDVRALGLAYEADSHWHGAAAKLANLVWARLEAASGGSDCEAGAAA